MRRHCGGRLWFVFVEAAEVFVFEKILIHASMMRKLSEAVERFEDFG